MGLIKTVHEVVRDRMNECVDVLAKQYMKSVRPIYGSNANGTPYHIGSCVLIEIGGTKYLITAAHVIDHNEETTLYVGGDRELIQLESEALTTKYSSGNRNDDKLDFAVLPLSSHIINQLGGVVFVEESSISKDDNDSHEKFYMALGFPNSKNKKIDNIGNKVKQNPFVYFSRLTLDNDIFKEVGASISQHYLLDFCSKRSEDESGNIVNSFSPKGTSGGALISVQGMTDPKSYGSNSECIGKLAGIIIENHKKQKVIMATKISVVISAIFAHSEDMP